MTTKPRRAICAICQGGVKEGTLNCLCDCTSTPSLWVHERCLERAPRSVQLSCEICHRSYYTPSGCVLALLWIASIFALVMAILATASAVVVTVELLHRVFLFNAQIGEAIQAAIAVVQQLLGETTVLCVLLPLLLLLAAGCYRVILRICDMEAARMV